MYQIMEIEVTWQIMRWALTVMGICALGLIALALYCAGWNKEKIEK